MAKVKGPLLSMRATGTIGKNIVFAAWRGVPYARQHVIPSNPRSVGQVATRSIFAGLNDIFRRLGTAGRAPWTAAAEGRPFTDRNHFIKVNLADLMSAGDLANLQGSPGVNGGPAMESFAAVAGVAAASIDVDWVEGALPAGWTIQSAVAIATLDADLEVSPPSPVTELEVLPPTPYAGAIVGLQSGASYAVTGWIVYIRSDNSLAYSPSITAIVNASA